MTLIDFDPIYNEEFTSDSLWFSQYGSSYQADSVNYTGTQAVCTVLLRIQCNLIQYFRDFSEYMAEDAVGVVLEADGETVIITNIEELVESDVEKYFVSKIVNRGKVYFKLAENC